MVSTHLPDADHARPDGTVFLPHEPHSAPLLSRAAGRRKFPRSPLCTLHCRHSRYQLPQAYWVSTLPGFALLLVSERLNRLELGRFPRWVEAEKNPHRSREQKG